ncbi:MAG: trimethyllysine dioxygenase [Ilumatobacter sp.]|nr:trimethyllysine dioxygenase [Ilumatobacter sp.]
MSAIEHLETTADLLHVTWDDGVTTDYLWLWLRDHATDAATIHPETHQRQLFTAGIDPALTAAEAHVDADVLRIRWSDPAEGVSELPIDFLRRFRSTASDDPAERSERVLWDGASILADWPSVDHDAVMRDDAATAEWLELVARYGFCIVTGTPPTVEATEALARRVGYVRETIFGGMWDFQADLSKADTAYTNLELRPHTDGTYSNDAPGLQLLHCLAFDGTGGESTMVDGFRAAAQLRVREPELYEVLSTVRVPGQYVGDGVHLRAERPILRHGPDGVLEQVSFNNADRAPFWLPADEMQAFYDAVRAFERRLNDERLQWRRVNPPGEALLFDNWRVLHGRLAYTGHRHLCGCYVNREDFLSRRRLLAASAGTK